MNLDKPVEAVFHEVFREQQRAHDKHGAASMRSLPTLSDRRYTVLSEEVGEVATALNDLANGALDPRVAERDIRAELVQVAAMASDWIMAIDGVFDHDAG